MRTPQTPKKEGPAPSEKDAWIVIPAYNEERTIGRVLKGLKREGFERVLVVDDGSRDRTAGAARSKGASVVSHGKNLGLGAALRTGLSKVRELGADFAVTFDADGQHDPKSVRALLEEVKHADLVVGVRQHFGIPLHKRAGNFILNLITCFFCGLFTDSQSGSRAFNRRALESIRIRSQRYEVSSEIIIQARRKGLRLREIPVKCFYTEYSKGGGTSIASGVKIFLELLRQELSMSSA